MLSRPRGPRVGTLRGDLDRQGAQRRDDEAQCVRSPDREPRSSLAATYAQIDAGTNFRHYAVITQTAERGKLDLMFVADAVTTRDGKLEALSRWPQYMAYFETIARRQ